MKKLCIIIFLSLAVVAFGQDRGRLPLQVPTANVSYKNAVSVSPGNYVNGATLQACIDNLASSANDGSMGDATNTNRRAILFTPGTYTANTADLILPQYVDLIGMGGWESVYLNLGTYSIKNTAVTETGDSVTNQIANITISGGRTINWNVGAGASRIYVSNCHLIGTISGYTSGNTAKTSYLWGCIIDSSGAGLEIGTALAGNVINAYYCLIRASRTDGTDSAFGANVYGVVNSGGSASYIKLYNCNIAATFDSSLAVATKDATAVGAMCVGLASDGDIRIYGGTIQATAISDDADETSSAYGVCLSSTSFADADVYGAVTEVTATNAAGTTVEYNYYDAGSTGALGIGDSWGDEAATSPGVIHKPSLNPPVVLTADTDLATLPNGVTITNLGDTGAVSHTMPAAIAGASIAFVDAVNTAGVDVTVTCAGMDVMKSPDDDTTTYTIYTHTIDKWGMVGWECFSDGYWHMIFSLGATE